MARLRRGVGLGCCQPRHDEARHVLGARRRSRHRRTRDRARRGRRQGAYVQNAVDRRRRRRRPADRPQAACSTPSTASRSSASSTAAPGARARTSPTCTVLGATDDAPRSSSRARRRARRRRVLERPARATRSSSSAQLEKLDVQIDIVPRLFEVVGPHVEVHKVEGIAARRRSRPRSASPSRASSSARWTSWRRILALVLAAPLFAYIAWRISRDSPGPVFFRQDRLGQQHARVHGAQVPDDACRHRRRGAPRVHQADDELVGDADGEWALQARARGRGDALRALAPADEPRRAAAADQRAARRDVARRAASVPRRTRPSTSARTTSSASTCRRASPASGR